MSGGPVHYELYVRRRPGGAWILDGASEDRDHMVAAAEETLATQHAVGVRVSKEVLNPETGGYSAFKVLEKGDLSPVRATMKAEQDDAPLCTTPADLYSSHSRDRIAELLGEWLDRHGATAFELLHGPALAEALEADGSELQHAIQKVAVPEALARGAATHAMVRAFQRLADAALERVIADGRRGAFPVLDPKTFADHAVRLCEEPDGAYLLGGGVAARLAGVTGWRAKTRRLLDLAEAAPTCGRPRALALRVIEAPLNEILGARGSLSDLARPEGEAEAEPLDLGGALAILTRMAAGREVAALARREPDLDRVLPPLQGEAARLAGLLDYDAFDAVRAAIARRVLAELNGPKRLRLSDPAGEIALLRALAMALTASAGRLLQLEDVRAAFVERSKRLVSADFVEACLAGRDGPLDEARALIRLAENVTGQSNRAACARWIGGVLTSLRFERALQGGDEPAGARLQQLADLQGSLRAVGLPEPESGRLLARLGEAGGWVEAGARVAATVSHSPGPLAARLQVLLRMAAGETAPLGPAADRARAEALNLLKAPAARGELAASPEAMAVVRELLPAAGLAA